MGSPSIFAHQIARQCSTRNYLMFIGVAIVLFSNLIHPISCGLAKMDCRKVGVEELIDEEGCDLMIVRINRCSGHCISFTFPNPITRTTSIHAKCCRMAEWEMLETELKCDGGNRQLQIPSAVQCECFDCAVQ